ncbi:MAG: 5'-nucleotidase [Niabella sp.]
MTGFRTDTVQRSHGRRKTVKAGALIFATALFSMITEGCSKAFFPIKQQSANLTVSAASGFDSATYRLYAPYKQKLDSEMHTVIGYAETALTKSFDEPETNLGNFFSDAILTEARAIDSTIDFVFATTKGGLRIDLPKGNITLEAIYELMPFENELWAITLKGTDVQKVLDFIARTKGQPVAGLRIAIQDKKPSLVYINDKAFDNTQTYRVVTSDYLLGGGDKVEGFAGAIEKKELHLKSRDALIRYITKLTGTGKNINSITDGRITIIKN